MSAANFEHLRMSMVGDVAVVEIITRDLQGPKAAQELSAELTQVVHQEWARQVLVDCRKVRYLSSSGFAALHGLVQRAKSAGRVVKFCNIDPDVRLGAEIVGLDSVAEIFESEETALRTFSDL